MPKAKNSLDPDYLSREELLEYGFNVNFPAVKKPKTKDQKVIDNVVKLLKSLKPKERTELLKALNL